jgi:hypothetical protein
MVAKPVRLHTRRSVAKAPARRDGQALARRASRLFRAKKETCPPFASDTFTFCKMHPR